MRWLRVVIAGLLAGFLLIGCRDEAGRITKNALVCDQYNKTDLARPDCAKAHRELTIQTSSGRTYTVRAQPADYYDLQPGDPWPQP